MHDLDLNWLPENLKLLPEELQDLGYKTHMIGKWHLGYCDWDLTPMNRGFPSFYGKIKGNSDYYTHNAQHKYILNYYDFFDGTRNVSEAVGHYSTTLFSDRAVDIIDEHTGNNPLFLYVAYQTAHVPYQAPERYYTDTNCSHIPYHNRKVYCGMLAAADEGIGNVTEALKRNGLYDNTIIVVTSDNGADPIHKTGSRSSSNYPLRGGKVTLWEGGTRVWAVIKAPGMVNPGTIWNSLFHVVDWKPTLVQAACGDNPSSSEDDGIPMYKELLDNKNGNRTKIIYNVMGPGGYAAARGPRFKLHWKYTKKSPGWYFPETIQPDIEEPTTEELEQLSEWHLYDLIEDPAERNNVYSQYANDPEVLELKDLIEAENSRTVPMQDGGESPLATVFRDQMHHWMPGWCESDPPASVCTPTPCQNGGTCIMEDSTRGYYCLCPRRASGDNCETLAPCEESEMQAGAYQQNAQSEVRADGFYITASDPSTPFKADYVLSGDKKADFENVIFEVLDGDAKRMTFNVYDDGKVVETGTLKFKEMHKGEQWTVPFLNAAVGDSMRFTVVPQDGVSAIALRVIHVGRCPQQETATTTTAAPNAPECGAGWMGYGDSCYKLFAGSSYDSAVTTCEGENGVLASAKTEAEFNFIRQTVAGSSALWLGGDDKANEGNWVWLDGSPVNNGYTNWKSGEPDGTHNGKDADCLWVTPGGWWRDSICSQSKQFVCRVDAGATATATTAASPATDCAASWNEYDGACYKFFASTAQYSDAVSACAGAREGAVLSPAKTQGEFEFLFNNLAYVFSVSYY
nr:hypothetical protein BaRGS_034127 [Batillaria attramentaria]